MFTVIFARWLRTRLCQVASFVGRCLSVESCRFTVRIARQVSLLLACAYTAPETDFCDSVRILSITTTGWTPSPIAIRGCYWRWQQWFLWISVCLWSQVLLVILAWCRCLLALRVSCVSLVMIGILTIESHGLLSTRLLLRCGVRISLLNMLLSVFELLLSCRWLWLSCRYFLLSFRGLITLAIFMCWSAAVLTSTICGGSWFLIPSTAVLILSRRLGLLQGRNGILAAVFWSRRWRWIVCLGICRSRRGCWWLCLLNHDRTSFSPILSSFLANCIADSRIWLTIIILIAGLLSRIVLVIALLLRYRWLFSSNHSWSTWICRSPRLGGRRLIILIGISGATLGDLVA